MKQKSKRLFAIFSLVLSYVIAGCAAGPHSYLRSSGLKGDSLAKVAIIPFANLSPERDADKKVTYTMITHLLSSNYFDVVEMGETEKAIQDSKARKDQNLSVENIVAIGKATGA